MMGSRIRDLRKARRWTQQRLSDEAGLDRGDLGNIEIGKRVRITPLNLAYLAQALGVSADYLLLGRGEPCE